MLVMKKKSVIVFYLPVCFLLFFTLAVHAQNHVLTGRVTDKNSKPLAGATVKIKGTDNATSTNEQGIFSFNNVPGNATLIISYVGYSDYSIRSIPGKTNEITLTEKIADEDAVIVTGVFDKRKKL